MGIASTSPTSRRGYLSQAELEQMANITVTNATEADDQISQAEEMIDSYVGAQEKAICEKITGMVAAAGANTLTLDPTQQNNYDVDYFTLCEVEILGGTGVGQRRKITASTKPGVITIDAAWTATPDITSFYRIYQLGKFPRQCDVETWTNGAVTTYYKQIPEIIKRAVAAQVEFKIEMGDAYFAGDKADKQSESIGDYSYSKGGSGGGVVSYKLISPKAKNLLMGITNRTGSIEL